MGISAPRAQPPPLGDPASSSSATTGPAAGGAGAGRGAPREQPSSSAPAPRGPQLLAEASAEIADIDGRLHALQSFLRMAKGGGALAPGAAAGVAAQQPQRHAVAG